MLGLLAGYWCRNAFPDAGAALGGWKGGLSKFKTGLEKELGAAGCGLLAAGRVQ